MGWGIKDILSRPFDPITDAIDRATREVLHSLGGVFDKIADVADDIYNMVYHTNSAMITSVRKGDVGAILLVLVIVLVAIFFPAVLAFLVELSMQFAMWAFALTGGLFTTGFLFAFAFGVMVGTLGGLFLAFMIPGSVWVEIAAASPWISIVLKVLAWAFPTYAVLFAAISWALAAAQAMAVVVFMVVGLPPAAYAPQAYDWIAEAKTKEDIIATLMAAGYTRESASSYLEYYSTTGVWDTSRLVAKVAPGELEDGGSIALPPTFNQPQVPEDNRMAIGILCLIAAAYWIA